MELACTPGSEGLGEGLAVGVGVVVGEGLLVGEGVLDTARLPPRLKP